MENCKILLIDIGGTHIDIYESCKVSFISSHLNRLSSKNLNIDNWIISLSNQMKICSYNEIIVGIPGEVKRSEALTYCSPLNQFINKKAAEDAGIKIVNDMYIQPFLIGKINEKLDEDLLIINIGTSIGICVVKKEFFSSCNFEYIKSYEFAHEYLSNIGQCQNIYDLVSKNSKFECQKFCSIYSVGGFAAAQNINVNVDKDQMLRVDKSNLKEKINTNAIDELITKEWIKSLELDLDYFLNKYNSSTSTLICYLRGGLHDAMKSHSQMRILESFSL